MLVRTLIVKYQCPKCNAHFQVERIAGDIIDIFVVLKSVDKDKSCHVCGIKMEINSVSAKAMKDVFGNQNFGFWTCSKHNSKKYYPNPLKKSITDKSMADFGEMGAAYVTITNNKFPWKCPICTNALKYRDERYEHFIC